MKTYTEEAVQAILECAKVQSDMLKERIAELEHKQTGGKMNEMRKHSIVAEIFGKEKLDRLYKLIDQDATVSNKEYKKLTDEYNEIWDSIG